MLNYSQYNHFLLIWLNQQLSRTPQCLGHHLADAIFAIILYIMAMHTESITPVNTKYYNSKRGTAIFTPSCRQRECALVLSYRKMNKNVTFYPYIYNLTLWYKISIKSCFLGISKVVLNINYFIRRRKMSTINTN